MLETKVGCVNWWIWQFNPGMPLQIQSLLALD